MAVIADRVVVELEAKLDRYNANLKRAEQTFARSVGAQQREIRALEAQIARSSSGIGNSLRGMAATFAAAFSVQQVKNLADGYTRFTNQLKVAGLEGAGLANVQERLFGTAQRYGVELESLGTLYSRGSQVAKELGASQAELLQFTNGVAAALKVQGGSAESAQGALLQLSQALGSGTVRAEEFNSINEGAIPILKAVAANLDGAGGSVAKLKQLVNDGKVSSDAFFRAFLAGTAELEAQAEKASLTIGASFTILNNALGKYIGEADQSLSATQQISQAIITLSENLDTVVKALALLGSILLGRYVAGMVAAATSTGVAGTAIFALQARAAGAATTMEALALTSATAGRAMLAAFGGPIGLAVTALAVGIGYLATSSAEADAAAADLTASIAAQTAQFADLQTKQDAARAEQNNLSATQRAALESTANLTGEANLLAEAWGRVAAQAKAAALEQARAAQVKARTNYREAKATYEAARERGFQRAAERPFVERGLSRDLPVSNPREALAAGERAAAAERAQLRQAARNFLTATSEVERVQNERLATFRPPAPAAPAAKPTKGGGRGRSGPSAETLARQAEREAEQRAQAAAQYANEIDQLNAEELQARADVTQSIEDRYAAEIARIDAEAAAYARQVALNKDLDDAQREKLLAERGQVDALRKQRAAQELSLADTERANNAARDAADLQVELLRAQLELTTGRRARAEIERRIYDLQLEQERAELRNTIATLELAGIKSEELDRAKARLAALDQLEPAQREKMARDAESPFERYRRSLDKTTDELSDQAEQLMVDEIERVRGAIRDTLADQLGVKDPLLKGLLDLLIEQVLFKPLMDAIAKTVASSGGGSVLGTIITGIGSALGGGRASGGHVVGGNLYRVNEGGGIEGFQPAGSGKIIPLGRMRTARGGSGLTLQQTVNVDARGVNPEGFAEHIKRSVRQETMAIVGQGMKQVAAGVPARMAQYERDGS